MAIKLASGACTVGLSWDDLCQNVPKMADITRELRHPGWHPQTDIPSTQPEPWQPSSSSSSSSSSSDSERSLSNGLVPWFQQALHGGCHLMQGILGTRLVPLCQDALRNRTCRAGRGHRAGPEGLQEVPGPRTSHPPNGTQQSQQCMHMLAGALSPSCHAVRV